MKLSIILELQCVDDIRYVLCSYRNMRKTTSENALSLSLRLFSLSFCLSLNIYTGIRIFSLISFLLFNIDDYLRACTFRVVMCFCCAEMYSGQKKTMVCNNRIEKTNEVRFVSSRGQFSMFVCFV